MHREGHIGAALLAYAPVGFVALALGFQGIAVLGAIGAGALAMVPDYDQNIPGIRHRGITHTVWFAGLVGLVLGVAGVAIGFGQNDLLAAMGLGMFGTVVGSGTILSHIAADSLTPMGVEPYAPIRDDHYTYGVARASNTLANYGLLILGGVAIVVALAAGSALSGVF
ncbi:metal-dependent hydrolase [Halorhabdus rudnickae]|uniref:metal-dependent hydrolase n=1 Tax=Halorhabdus rudnickae TaxID=1775544 RepID=UPI00108488B0|nr:metal-dependent hydrolase [Halorhabdus rudnickae]